jgi:hypothetical protein
MSKRGRIVVYGAAVALVLAGSACGALVDGTIGTVLAMALLGSGLVILTGLVFMEVGLSEDREREQEQEQEREREREREAARRQPAPAPPPRRLQPTRPPRLRGPRHD